MRAAADMDLGLGATDRLLLAFLGALAVLTVMEHGPASVLVQLALIAAAIVLVAAWARGSERGRVVHDFFAVPVVVATFEVLGAVIPLVSPVRWDVTFADLDVALFGRLPRVWLGLLGRPNWLTDLASLAYVAYYPLPVAIGVGLYARDRVAFRRFVFVVVATFIASYVGYLLFPTLGPRTTDDARLGGGAVSRAVRAFIAFAEGNPLDAFPSGHTAIALVSVGLGWSAFPRRRPALAGVFAGIVFSTVYLSYHYVIDVVAGVALGVAALVALPPLARRVVEGQRPSSQVRQRSRSQAMRSKRPPRYRSMRSADRR